MLSTTQGRFWLDLQGKQPERPAQPSIRPVRFLAHQLDQYNYLHSYLFRYLHRHSTPISLNTKPSPAIPLLAKISSFPCLPRRCTYRFAPACEMLGVNSPPRLWASTPMTPSPRGFSYRKRRLSKVDEVFGSVMKVSTRGSMLSQRSVTDHISFVW